jgi:N-acetylglutamate synthase-like GNAT family acetyltransferase
VTKSLQLRVRRATTDDLQSLKTLWESMLLPAKKLKKRPTEFLVAETADGKILGAIGVQIVRQHARLHSEGFFDFAFADQARHLFWERIQTVASNHGVFRLWTQDTSPFWTQSGFQSASAEKLSRLPEEWNQTGSEWFTLQLKDEEVITNALDKDFATFMSGEKQNTTRIRERARTLKTIITIIGFSIGIVCFCVVIYLIVHSNPFSTAR